MRAKNREINIFNMSLLDILTGMLGAFLFLMVGLVPYYAKVMKGTVISQEEKKKLDELKDLLEKGLKGPLSPEEVEQIKQEMEKLRADNDQLTTSLDQAKKDLQDATAENNFWTQQNVLLGFTAVWDSKETNIDVFILMPDGEIYGSKKEKLLGKEVFKEGVDSHYLTSANAVVASPVETHVFSLMGAGDYLVFYRVPQNAAPATYVSLTGFWMYRELEYDPKQINQGSVWVFGDQMLKANAALAQPGGLYAWAVFTYDPNNRSVSMKPVSGNLPPGIQKLP